MIAVVLHESQDLVNIAHVVRALKNFGFRDLRLVSPREYDPYRIEGIAHQTQDVLARVARFARLEDALLDCVHVVGFTARGRTAKRNLQRPREAAAEILKRGEDGPVALLFGREDKGLPNEALDRCHRVVTIPTSPAYPSLNLAHAVVLMLYELALARGDEQRPFKAPRREGPPVTVDDLERLFADAEAGLPTRMTGASGCRVWDAAGREYVDYVMALGAVALGYGHPAVNRAAEQAIAAGVVGPLPPVLEEELADALAMRIPWLEQVRFLKTGAEAVAAAVRLARVATGRDRVLGCGYHGWLDWSQGGEGVPAATRALYAEIPFNDVDGTRRLIREAGDRLAVVVIEPVVVLEPTREWLEALRAETTRIGAVLVFRSEEHTSELQSRSDLVCRLLLEKKK